MFCLRTVRLPDRLQWNLLRSMLPWILRLNLPGVPGRLREVRRRHDGYWQVPSAYYQEPSIYVQLRERCLWLERTVHLQPLMDDGEQRDGLCQVR